MLNRKATRANVVSPRSEKRQGSVKTPLARRRFVLPSGKRKAQAEHHAKTDPTPKAEPAKPDGKSLPTSQQLTALTNPTASSMDLTETVKTLLHLAQEHGYVTYDDINDVLPDGLNPEDLDTLFSKLRSLDVEIVERLDVLAEEAERSDGDARCAGVTDLSEHRR